jgi:hypothetical protein
MTTVSSADKLERFVRWFLRLNGYFTVENFIVHAAGDSTRISNGLIAPHTEVDTLAVRMPYSHETAGTLHIANWEALVGGSNGRFDVVIAESKSGAENRPNTVWRDGDGKVISYLVRFIGLYKTEDEIKAVAAKLASSFEYEDDLCRFRYAIFSNSENDHYRGKRVTYFTYESMVRFLVEVRGQCWIEKNIGVASIHDQWDPLIKAIFDIANDHGSPVEERRRRIMEELQ